MAFTVYKPGQGHFTRLYSAIGFGALMLAGVRWIASSMEAIQSPYLNYIKASVAVGIIATFGLLIWYLFYINAKVVDFMIATEAEMRKVNWPTWRGIRGKTWVVICGMFLMAAILFGVDLFFVKLFQSLRILVGGNGFFGL